MYALHLSLFNLVFTKLAWPYAFSFLSQFTFLFWEALVLYEESTLKRKTS